MGSCKTIGDSGMQKCLIIINCSIPVFLQPRAPETVPQRPLTNTAVVGVEKAG